MPSDKILNKRHFLRYVSDVEAVYYVPGEDFTDSPAVRIGTYISFFILNYDNAAIQLVKGDIKLYISPQRYR